jgi:D-glycero-alpha-D-manno-heptose 1-phosphate guanylyltransferase
MGKQNSSGEKPDAIILAAGTMGRVKLFPKALLEHEGKSVIEHRIEWLKPYVNRIVIACHENECKEISDALGRIKGVEFSKEKQLLGTAGAVKKALEKTSSDKVIVCNVDDLTDIDLNALTGFGANAICVANPRINYGIIEIDNMDIKAFREKPIIKELWASCGVYLLNRETAFKLPEKGSLEKDIFPYLGDLRAFKHFGIWKTFGK